MGVVSGHGQAVGVDWNLIAKSVGFSTGSDAENFILTFFSKAIEIVQGG